MKKIISVLIITLFMTGCVKLNASINIHKDKSMDYEILMAFDQSLTNQSINTDSITEAKNNGFTVKEYYDNNKKGYKFTKHINNIDSISTNKDILGSLDINNNDKYLFSVKKGFIKNKYTAKLTSYNTDISSINQIYDTANIDYNTLSNMDVKFYVTLPYKAISTNAQTSDGKNLSWNLLTFNKDNVIEFEFELYNYTNIIILSISLFILLVIIVVLLNIKRRPYVPKKKETSSNDYNEVNQIDNKDIWTNEQKIIPENNQADIFSQENIQPIQNETMNNYNQNNQN